MPTVNPGQNEYHEGIEPGNVVTVVTPAGGTALVRRHGVNGGQTKTSVAAGSTVAFGPYNQQCRVSVTAFSQPCTVTETTADVALAYVDPADGVLKAGGVAVTSASNALIAQRAALGPSAIRQISNFYATDGNASAPGKTYTLKIALPVRDAVAIRLVIASTVAASIAGVRAIASSSASPSEPYNNAGTWTAATFGGASSGTLPSGSAALPSVTRSDWIPVVPVAPSDGGPRTIYHLRVFIPNTSTSAPVVGTGSSTNFTAWTDALNQEWICSVNVGDNVTTAISSYSAVVDDLVKGLDDYVRAVCASGAALLVDYSLIMSNAVTPGVARLWKTGYNDAAGGDGLHPSSTGYAAGASDPTYGTTAVLSQVF